VTIDYNADQSVAFGSMSVVCPHYKALKYRNESPELCYASGKIKLTPLVPLQELLRSLVSGTGLDANHFMTKNQKYISASKRLHLASFHAHFQSNLLQHSTFSHNTHSHHSTLPHNMIIQNKKPLQIQNQIYYRESSQLTPTNADYTFIQIYFISNLPQLA